MELRAYLPVLRAHWVAIVLITLIGGVAAFGWTLLQPKVYQADSSGYVSAGSNSDTGNALVGDNLAQSKVRSYIDVGTSRAVAQFAIDDLGLTNTSPEALVSRIVVSNPTDTVLIKVTAEGPSPSEARDLAEAWLRGIAQQISTIEGAGDGSTSVVQLIPLDSAVLPSNPTSPNTRLAIAVGLGIGAILGLAYAFIRHTLDRRIRDSASVERESGVAVVGTIPIDRRFTDEDRLVTIDGSTDYAMLADDDVAVAEALRELRTNLQFMDVDNPPRVIVVTSPLPGDGKSTTIANLAIVLAAGGQPVILVDADLRRPTVSRTFNLVGGAGLTDVLAGRSDAVDVLQPWGSSGRLLIMAAGKTPPNPSELLGSERMHALVEELSEHAIVLIDAPPLIPVTDAAILSHNTDGALVVASVGKTTFEALSKALQNLQRANGRCLGVILNRVPRRGPGSSYGYYGYRGDYRSRPDDGPESNEPPETDSGAEARGATQEASTVSSTSRSSHDDDRQFQEIITGTDLGDLAPSEARTDSTVTTSNAGAMTRRELRARAKDS
ncbi:polysaccharide biosynthesis tyrosine autokinase [Herbiconiux moechotypicola]|uniref:Polysaccharide biosynthesis tyrosine autokinase n=1 Tax=Herbiconiux moechotypicola TaxID=637393 RepID=A0ABN3DR06_9MICO|nr:polysaccharide biosynthesis tyrosine autokinase [Herbiconiux moechotypicola]MCS5731496.1 polysaccharide biosynthesis tyrosine autokinase [Herbiconiux moechotypicola]